VQNKKKIIKKMKQDKVKDDRMSSGKCRSSLCMPMQYQAIIHINLYTAIDIQVTVHRDIFLY